MNRNRVTVRYAKALLELATEQNILDEVGTNIRLLFAALEKVKNFNNFICNNSKNSKLKFKAIHTTFGSEFNELTLKFIDLIISSNREEYLKDICRNFIHLCKLRNRIVTATLTTAIEIDEKIAAQIMIKFEQKLNAKLEYTTYTNPELLGGFILTIDGQQYDASLANKIKSIKSQLITTI